MTENEKLASAEDYINSGSVRSARGDYYGAITDFTQAIQLDPNNFRAYFLRGCTYIKDERSGLDGFDRGIVDIEAALRLNPNNSHIIKALEMAREGREAEKKAQFWREREEQMNNMLKRAGW